MWGSLFKGCSEVEKAEEVKENELAGKTSKRDKSMSKKQKEQFSVR